MWSRYHLHRRVEETQVQRGFSCFPMDGKTTGKWQNSETVLLVKGIAGPPCENETLGVVNEWLFVVQARGRAKIPGFKEQLHLGACIIHRLKWWAHCRSCRCFREPDSCYQEMDSKRTEEMESCKNNCACTSVHDILPSRSSKHPEDGI